MSKPYIDISDARYALFIIHRMLEQMRLTVEQNLRRMKWKQLGLQRRKGRWRRN